MRKMAAITRHCYRRKLINSMLSKKIKSNERITLIQNDEIIKTEKQTTKVLTISFRIMSKT